MANTIRIKRRTTGSPGAPTQLQNAELAYNEVDDILYYGKGTGGVGGSATTVIPIGGTGGFVQLTGAQTVAGTKTFSSSPVIPTPSTADNSTLAASTAFVKAQGYLTSNQTVTLSGDATGSGSTSIAVTLANSGATSGTYNNSQTAITPITVDVKGRITSTGAAVTITPAWGSITSKPTTIAGYGITDAQPLDADLTAIAGLVGTTGFLKKTATDTWTLDTATYLTGNQSIQISGDASGSGTTAISITLQNSGVTAGTYNNVATEVRPFTVDAKGRVTAIGTAVTIAPAWSSITSKPTTISGFGITDAYTKTEVDTLLQGLDPKQQVKAATTANITLSGTQTIDGVALSAGDRVLVKDQTTPSQNGIYVVAAGAWSRSADMDSWQKVLAAYMFVEEGTTQADFAFVCVSNAGGTLGTTAISFVQFNGAGGITAGTGITRQGNTVSVSTELAGYHNNATNGIITRTAGGTITGRTIGTSGTGVSISNGDGVSGNPTISLSAALSTIGGLTPAADQVSYYTSGSAAALMTVTSFARSFLDDVDAASVRTTLGLGTIQTQSASSVNITGGQITNLTTFDGITVDCGTF